MGSREWITIGVVLVVAAPLLLGALMHHRRAEPTPPDGVSVQLADGREIPVDCAYIGRRGKDHVWRMVTPVAGPMCGVHIRSLPPNTIVEGYVADE